MHVAITFLFFKGTLSCVNAVFHASVDKLELLSVTHITLLLLLPRPISKPPEGGYQFNIVLAVI
jgi:hypothetical protein